MKNTCAIAILALFAISYVQAQTTVINNTCSVNVDVTQATLDALPLYISGYTVATQYCASFTSSNSTYDVLTGNPLDNGNLFRNYLWASTRGDSLGNFAYFLPGIGLSNGLYLNYGYDVSNLVLLYCPATR